MEIIVCIKPVCMNPIRFSLSGGKIDPGNSSLVINEVDEYALEQALVMKKELGASLTAITVGGLVYQNALYVAKAKGVDRAIRVDADYADPVSVSEILAKAIGPMHFDMILTGIESFDNMSGQTGIYLAEKLGLPVAYAVTAINAEPGLDLVRIEKELGGGVYQVLDMRLPAVFCIQSGIQPLKYTPPAKLLSARREKLESLSLQELGPVVGETVQPMRPKLANLFKPERTSKVEILEGKSGEVASALVGKILEVS